MIREREKKKKKELNIKCAFWFPLQLSYETFQEEFSQLWSQMYVYIDLLVKYLLFSSYFNDTWFFLRQSFVKYSNVKFNKSLSSRVVPLERMEGETDVMKLIVSFRNFVKEPKNSFFNVMLFITRISLFELKENAFSCSILFLCHILQRLRWKI